MGNWSVLGQLVPGFVFARCQTKHGVIYIHEPPEYVQIYADLAYQPNIRQMIETDKYDVFVDVGAAFGVFSLTASFHCKRVIAYEASPFIYGLLLLNLAQRMNVDCRYAYVSCKGDTPRIGLWYDMIHERDRVPYNIPVAVLDNDLNFLFGVSEERREGFTPSRALIKIDVEGNEENVLRGCEKLLQCPNIDWTVDVHPMFGKDPVNVEKFFPQPRWKCTRIGENRTFVQG